MRTRTPNRRAIESFDFTHGNNHYHIGYSRFSNGNIREIFVDAGKPDSAVHTIGRDIGIALSIMLQSGMLLSDFHKSMTQLDDGEPAGPLGIIIKRLVEEW